MVGPALLIIAAHYFQINFSPFSILLESALAIIIKKLLR